MAEVCEKVDSGQRFGDYTRPRARKKHRCAWCGEDINPGEAHYKFVGEFEGDFQSWRIHDECRVYMEYIVDYEPACLEHGFEEGEYSRGLSKDVLVARRLAGIDWYWMPDADQDRF
jgi:hypothetical protein